MFGLKFVEFSLKVRGGFKGGLSGVKFVRGLLLDAFGIALQSVYTYVHRVIVFSVFVQVRRYTSVHRRTSVQESVCFLLHQHSPQVNCFYKEKASRCDTIKSKEQKHTGVRHIMMLYRHVSMPQRGGTSERRNIGA